MDRMKWGVDKLKFARLCLVMGLCNRINHKIRNRQEASGSVEFYTYRADFLRIFDRVKVETHEL